MADRLATLRLAEQLIACRSVTPADGGCQRVIAERLAAAGFDCTPLPRGDGDATVDNLWAHRPGRRDEAPRLVFAGHTDVVPTGPIDRWHSDPFVPTHRAGCLYGRGAADMKTSLAAMVVACEEFVADTPDHAGSLAMLITSDEEGPAVEGTVAVCDWLRAQDVRIDHCIVGEPTSVDTLGDMVKNGRRGTLSGRLVVHGLQGHIAYPHLARNPIHALSPALAELTSTVWDQGNAQFPPTSFQVSNIHAGTGAGNVIPGEATVDFNFRFAPVSAPDTLRRRVAEVLQRHGVEHTLGWTLGGLPYQTDPGALSAALCGAITDVTGIAPSLSTTGGTSDGRFLAQICAQVVEFGPVNASIHQIDEHVAVDSIEPLKNIYLRTLQRLIA